MFVVPVGACVLKVIFNQQERILIVGGSGFGCDIHTLLTRSTTRNKSKTFNLVADNSTLVTASNFFAHESLSGKYRDSKGNDIVCVLGG